MLPRERTLPPRSWSPTLTAIAIPIWPSPARSTTMLSVALGVGDGRFLPGGIRRLLARWRLPSPAISTEIPPRHCRRHFFGGAGQLDAVYHAGLEPAMGRFRHRHGMRRKISPPDWPLATSTAMDWMILPAQSKRGQPVGVCHSSQLAPCRRSRRPGGRWPVFRGSGRF